MTSCTSNIIAACIRRTATSSAPTQNSNASWRSRKNKLRGAWRCGLLPRCVARVREALHDAWEIVLRNQFHDVLPGTSIAEVYEDARAEYARAHELCDRALASARAMLPRAARAPRPPARRVPVENDGGYDFDNGILRAHVLPSGTIVELATRGGRNAVAQANVLALYRDRPKKWEAWNIDASYERRMRPARPQGASIVDGGARDSFPDRFVSGHDASEPARKRTVPTRRVGDRLARAAAFASLGELARGANG